MTRPVPSIDEFRTALSYDAATGLMRWIKPRLRSGAKAGDIAGTPDPLGYVIITYAGHHYKAHRLAWLLFHGEWPLLGIDHIDGDPSNNAIANLRIANQMQNGFNRKRPKNNSSGIKGVHWNKHKQRWQAQLTINGRVTFLGRFLSITHAEAAVKSARENAHGVFARHD